MCEPRKTTVFEVVGDVVAGVATAVGAVARVAVRFGYRRSPDEVLEHDRRVLCWRFLIEAIVAAAVVYWLGRSAMWVFVGAAVVSWTVGYLVHAELRRRRDDFEIEVEEHEIELDADGRPRLEAVS